MRGQRFFQFFVIFSAALFAMDVFLYCKREMIPRAETDSSTARLSTENNLVGGPIEGLIAQNYMGPIKKIPGNPYLVRIEVVVRDSPELAGVQIESVEFDGESIPLKPRDVYGNRGAASFQKAPGQYPLKWVVQRDKFVWPRDITYKEEVVVSPSDLWIQISIVGEKASIQ